MDVKTAFLNGLQISQSPRGIFINQSKYALESLKKYGFESCDPVDTPMVEKSKLDEDKERKAVDPSHYRGMIGTLLYLTASRPDRGVTIMVVVDGFSKMVHFVPCSKTYDASQVARLYFFEILRLHGMPKTLMYDQNVNFDLTLAQAEFAYNKSTSHTTGKSLFFIVYGRHLITPLDLAPIPIIGPVSVEGDDRSKQIKEPHQKMREQITKHNQQYQDQANKHRKRVLYKEGDLVWIRFRKERFLAGRSGKLKPRADGPIRVLKKINDNAYKLELPCHYNVSATLNVVDLSSCVGTSDDEMDSRANAFQGVEDDTGALDHSVNMAAYLTF
uniref:Tf2-1-like SH3-like domain-containing protein n=1 Tax=Tanacetum cinerariifolium TaxID=118510 RepID=A0A6L2K7R5_TANCI|nr:hypothetical protein [Tanacetum cinerariifolium]